MKAAGFNHLFMSGVICLLLCGSPMQHSSPCAVQCSAVLTQTGLRYCAVLIWTVLI